MLVVSRRRTLGYASSLALSLAAMMGTVRRTEAAVHPAFSDSTGLAWNSRFANATELIRFVDDSLRGHSGKLFARFLAAGVPSKALPAFQQTPRYNARDGDTSGRAQLSRHMFGDASDVFVDNDGDGKTTSEHGPFAHIDVRGKRARWGVSR